MTNDSPSLAARGFHPSIAPTLPHRLISWITRRASPGCNEDPADAPLCAQGLLKQLLDRHPQARGVFTHLAAVERCLRVEGVAALGDLSAGTLERARAELLSISGASDVRCLLDLLAEPHHPRPAQEIAPSMQMREGPVNPLPGIENLEVDEVDEQAYLTAVMEWEESVHAGLG
jgi:hypothetical protein